VQTLKRLSAAEELDQVILVANKDDFPTLESLELKRTCPKLYTILTGGKTRTDSVLTGLNAITSPTELVAIHDGARPFVLVEDINRVISSARENGAAILASRVQETIKRERASANHEILETIPRSDLWLAQTPQVFSYELIKSSYKKVQSIQSGEMDRFTDDASIVEALGYKVHLVESSGINLKITTPYDLFLAEALWQKLEDSDANR
jgi:2-C-methyl-D-erythritol 4-phosphate cytidylyltransferase